MAYAIARPWSGPNAMTMAFGPLDYPPHIPLTSSVRLRLKWEWSQTVGMSMLFKMGRKRQSFIDTR